MATMVSKKQPTISRITLMIRSRTMGLRLMPSRASTIAAGAPVRISSQP